MEIEAWQMLKRRNLSVNYPLRCARNALTNLLKKIQIVKSMAFSNPFFHPINKRKSTEEKNSDRELCLRPEPICLYSICFGVANLCRKLD